MLKLPTHEQEWKIIKQKATTTNNYDNKIDYTSQIQILHNITLKIKASNMVKMEILDI